MFFGDLFHNKDSIILSTLSRLHYHLQFHYDVTTCVLSASWQLLQQYFELETSMQLPNHRDAHQAAAAFSLSMGLAPDS